MKFSVRFIVDLQKDPLLRIVQEKYRNYDTQKLFLARLTVEYYCSYTYLNHAEYVAVRACCPLRPSDI